MKSITRAALAAAASVALLSAVPATASAGEVNGKGDPITVHANSICAYSGLEDHPVDPGTTQNWGQLGKEGRAAAVEEGEAPWLLCNGHLLPWQDVPH